MEKVRIGIIGVTGRGELYKYWHKPDGRSVVVGGADVRQDALDEFRTNLGNDLFVTLDYRKLLSRDDIDAVAITSPDFTHEEYAVAALEAGKDVFCEKPMAITTDGCDRILKAWETSGKKLMIGHNMRYMRIFRTMKEIAGSGVIGEIKAVWVRHFVGYGGDWYFHDWHAVRKKSTGLLLQKACHDIDMIHWITGVYTKKVAAFGSLDFFGGDKRNDLVCSSCSEKDTCAEAQFDTRQQCAFRKEIDVEDNTVVIMELENGIKASYQQCHFAPDYFRNYTFIGTEGRMENLDDDSKVIVLTRDQSKEWKNYANRTYEIKPAVGEHGGADPVICKDFVDMVVSDKAPLAIPEAGRMSVATGCAATESLRNGGKVIEVPPLPQL